MKERKRAIIELMRMSEELGLYDKVRCKNIDRVKEMKRTLSKYLRLKVKKA